MEAASMRIKIPCGVLGAGLMLAMTCSAQFNAADHVRPIVPPTNQVLSVSTSPSNGDTNPYGVAFVPKGFPDGGPLSPGDVLVSNFNSNSGIQGTGTTIVQIKQGNNPSTVPAFFAGTAPLGLTTALGVLKRGFVIVGNVTTTDSTCNTITQGSLLIIDRYGNLVTTLADAKLLDGPWDLTIHDDGDFAQVFVSNVLSGTVTRLDLRIPFGSDKVFVENETQIASHYGAACNSAAVVVGPTGLAYDDDRDFLYVASTDDNAIYAVPHAGRTFQDHGTGPVVYSDNVHLHGPLGLTLAPNGDLITANGDAINQDPNQLNEIVEFTPSGKFVAQFQVDTGAAGAAFGLAVTQRGNKILFAAVDNNTGNLDEWQETLGH
jgi:hypothetical protein